MAFWCLGPASPSSLRNAGHGVEGYFLFLAADSGMVNFWPGRIGFFSEMLLAAVSAFTDTPCRRAITLKLSPALTT